MTLQLRCFESSGTGKVKVVDLPETKSLRVRCRDKGGLEVIMEFKRNDERRCALVCRGDGKAFLEGMMVEEADLDVGAVVEVGKQRFEIAVPTGEVVAPRLVKNKEHLDLPCSHCGTPFTAEDCSAAWVDGKFRICVSCLAKGVRPQHLPDWRYSLEVDVDDPIEAVGETVAYSKAPVQPRRSSSSGAIPLGTNEPRSRRRISASSNASIPAIDPSSDEQKSIIGKVTRVFRRRSSEDGSHDRERLTQLEDHRRALLLESGRASLTHTAGIGLPEAFLAQISEGETVSISMANCDRTALDDWRSRQRQLAHLDAEISALRNALGMGSDPHLPVAKVTLRTEQDALEDRAFQASDGLRTEDLGKFTPDEESLETDAYSASDLPHAEEPATAQGADGHEAKPRRDSGRGGVGGRRAGQRRRRR